MSTLKELTEDTTDRQQGHKLAHLKTYSFHVFYQPIPPHSHSTLQKLSFKFKDPAQNPNHQQKNNDCNRQVNIFFYNMENSDEKIQGLMDLKGAGLQSKIKLVGYCSEQALLDLLLTASTLYIDTSNIPIILTNGHPNSDLSIFSGWNHQTCNPFHQTAFNNLQGLSKKWIQSSQQKVDVWKTSIQFKEDGRLQKLQGDTFKQIQINEQFQKLFLSHLSLGYHVRLSKRYQQRCNPPSHKTSNAFLYKWQKFKNFCCLGTSNMRTSTGVVNISFVDEKGREVEILKHLREYDGSEESELEASRVVKSDRGIYSLLVANIDRFQGNKLEELGCKPGDGKIQVVLFEGVEKCRRVASVGAEVVLGVESQCVQLQIGEAVYRCWGVRQLRITHASRLKIAISRQFLSC